MDERQISPRGGLRLDDPVSPCDAPIQQLDANEVIFLGREHVRPDVDLIVR